MEQILQGVTIGNRVDESKTKIKIKSSRTTGCVAKYDQYAPINQLIPPIRVVHMPCINVGSHQCKPSKMKRGKRTVVGTVGYWRPTYVLQYCLSHQESTVTPCKAPAAATLVNPPLLTWQPQASRLVPASPIISPVGDVAFPCLPRQRYLIL